jgi:anti-sigma-K factor RskA
MLMTFFLDEHFTPESMELAARVRSEEYYVNMMIAWYFATALAKLYPAALTYLENRRLALWTLQQGHPEGHRELQDHPGAKGHICAHAEDQKMNEQGCLPQAVPLG